MHKLIVENEEYEVLMEIVVSSSDDSLKLALDIAAYIAHRYSDVTGCSIEKVI